MDKILLAVVLIFFSLNSYGMGYGSPTMKGATRVAKPPKFTVEETNFLKAIASKASSIITKNIQASSVPYECIVKYKRNPADCPMGKDYLSAVKNAYAQYRIYYIMANYESFLHGQRYLGSGGMGVSLSFTNYATPFSSHMLKVNNTEVDTFKGLQDADRNFIANQQGDCKFTAEDREKFYSIQLSQIISLVPVVLFLETAPGGFLGMGKLDPVPTDENVIQAYEELIDSYTQTRHQFENYQLKDLEGLFAYQMLAEQVIKADEDRWMPVFDSLSKKLLPQSVLEHAGIWFRNTFFSLNALFIGCVVVAIFTVNPLIGLACGIAATINSGVGVLREVENYQRYYREWVSGVRGFDDLEGQRWVVAIDTFQFLIATHALKALFGHAAAKKEIRDFAFHLYSLATATTKEGLKKGAVTSLKEIAMGESKTLLVEMGGIGASMIAKGILNSVDLERMNQASAEILLRYKKVGYFTFKDRYEVVCRKVNPAR